MNNNEIIKRYVYAVTRLLPKKGREEVSKEIEASIYEMLEARCGEITPTEQDVRVILAELGSPDELAGKYDTDKMNHLIGGVYYTKYKLVLKIVLIAAVIGSALACILGMLLEREQNPLEILWKWSFDTIPTMVVNAFAIITFIFAVFERKNVRLGDGGSIDNLPSVPEKKEKISVTDCIVDSCFAIFFTVLILCFGDVVPVVTNISDSGNVDIMTVPLFDMAAVQTMWIPLVLWTVATIVSNIVRLIEGRRNLKVLITDAVAGIVAVVCAYLLFVSANILNVDALGQVAALTGDAESVLLTFFGHIGLVIFVCTVFGHTVNFVTNLIYALKSKA